MPTLLQQNRILTRRPLKRGSFKSVDEFEQRIGAFIGYFNVTNPSGGRMGADLYTPKLMEYFRQAALRGASGKKVPLSLVAELSSIFKVSLQVGLLERPLDQGGTYRTNH